MFRTKLITTVAAAALTLPVAAHAESPQASTETGSEVASQQTFTYDTNSPRINNGMAEFDASSIAMPSKVFRALANARGENLETTEGDVVGMIEAVNVNAQGNPELVVDIKNDSAIPAEVLVVTVQPGNVKMMNNKLFLDTSLRELELKASKNSVRDSQDRVSVTLF